MPGRSNPTFSSLWPTDGSAGGTPLTRPEDTTGTPFVTTTTPSHLSLRWLCLLLALVSGLASAFVLFLRPLLVPLPVALPVAVLLGVLPTLLLYPLVVFPLVRLSRGSCSQRAPVLAEVAMLRNRCIELNACEPFVPHVLKSGIVSTSGLREITVLTVHCAGLQIYSDGPLNSEAQETFLTRVLETVGQLHGCVWSFGPGTATAVWWTKRPPSAIPPTDEPESADDLPPQYWACKAALELARTTEGTLAECVCSILTGLCHVGVLGTKQRRAPYINGAIWDVSPQLVQLNMSLGTRVLVSDRVATIVCNRLPCQVMDHVKFANIPRMAPFKVFELLNPDEKVDMDCQATFLAFLESGPVAAIEYISRHPAPPVWDALSEGDVREYTPQQRQLMQLHSVTQAHRYSTQRMYLRVFQGWGDQSAQESSTSDNQSVVTHTSAASETLRRQIIRHSQSTVSPAAENTAEGNILCGPRRQSEIEAQTYSPDGDASPHPQNESETFATAESAASPAAQVSGICGQFVDTEGHSWAVSDIVIGRGGFGAVHLGMDTNGALVAVKQLRAVGVTGDLLETVLKEICLLSQFNHRNVVRYLGSGICGNNVMVVMEYVAGGTLETIMRNFRHLPLSSIGRYASDTLKGLAYLHKNDVLHRDVKPRNVLVGTAGSCKLADFGTAGKLGTECNAGTLVYMAPETLQFKQWGKASDIWSFGVMLHQLVAGVLPFTEDNAYALVHKLRCGEAPLRDFTTTVVHPDVVEVVADCLSLQPERRSSAKDLLQLPFFSRYVRRSFGSPLVQCRTSVQSARTSSSSGSTERQRRRNNGSVQNPLHVPARPSLRRNSDSLITRSQVDLFEGKLTARLRR
eukprot:TRINITY_DN9358_c0_g1_i1.p1 TRINITY_DN9358_c0_g1~~TRINITY_DN9358_c0_g1_i1.p1  ORF type:complete len:858 (+),score=92.00 TRINITY_DN9358_c0_g1_i1:41-2614(+)